MYFGSLLVGYYGSRELLFAGRVGTGFSEKALAALYDGLQRIKRTTCPFVARIWKRPNENTHDDRNCGPRRVVSVPTPSAVSAGL